MNNRDIRVTVLLHADEFTWLRDAADERDMSQSAFIRNLILKSRQKVETAKVSSENSNLTSAELTHISTQQLANLLTITTKQVSNLMFDVKLLKEKVKSNTESK